MKSNRKSPAQTKAHASRKSLNPSSLTALAIGKKLLEIKRISGEGEITELNMALWRHLK
jgi:hypothetical protein